MTTWRFLDTGASSASLNMAIDQAILAARVDGKCPPTVRIYRWSPPAISLGYFQRRHGIDLSACRRLGIDVVRRPTGGRAVLHSGDLSYSVVAGITDGMPSSVTGAYRLISEALLAAFRILGFEAELRGSNAKSLRSDLCFLTSSAGDVLHGGRKFLGSAQTWKGDYVLQHGSIILEPCLELWASLQMDRRAGSAEYEQMLGRYMTSIKDILGRVPETREMVEAIKNGMSRSVGMDFREDILSSDELDMAGEIADTCTRNGHHLKEEKQPERRPLGQEPIGVRVVCLGDTFGVTDTTAGRHLWKSRSWGPVASSVTN